MATKLTYDYVKNYIEENGDGDKLVSEEYEDSHGKLTINCHWCNKDFEMSFTNYKTGNRHQICMLRNNAKKRKFSYDYVKNYIECTGCVLLSDVYVNQTSKLNIIFSCGHQEQRSFADFKNGRNICSRCSGAKKYTFEEVKNIIENNGYKLLSENYKNCNYPLDFIDSDDYKYGLSFSKFLRRHVDKENDFIIKYDKINPYGEYNFKLFMDKNNVNFYLEDGQKWVGANSKMIFSDDVGYKYYIRPFSILRGFNIAPSPDKFSVHNIFTLENLSLWLRLNNKTFSLVDNQKYTGSVGRLKCKCHICHPDEVAFNTNLTNIISGRGCGLCAGKQIGKFNNLFAVFPRISREFDVDKNYPISPMDITPCNIKKYWWICPDCGKSYQASVCSRTGKRSYGCGVCAESNLEKNVRKFLEENNINFKPQKRYDDCKDKKKLAFDFYLTDYNVLCECQGKQHMEPIEFFGGIPTFEIQQRHDKIKKEYCFKNNIKLIEITYKDNRKIDEIFIKELNLKRKEVALFGN